MISAKRLAIVNEKRKKLKALRDKQLVYEAEINNLERLRRKVDRQLDNVDRALDQVNLRVRRLEKELVILVTK